LRPDTSHRPRLPGSLKSLSTLLALLALALAVLETASATRVRAEAGRDSSRLQLNTSGFQGFHLVDSEQGWLLISNQLYWTSDRGSTWTRITPSLASSASTASVFFLDRQVGWVVLVAEGAVDPVFYLAATRDGGATWSTQSLAFFSPGDIDAYADTVYQDWLDAQTGWIVVKRASGTNFSLGTLFRTTDGGRTWARVSVPIGEPVTFASTQVGWVAGGAAGDELYRTLDGGLSWQSFSVGQSGSGLQTVYMQPDFIDAYSGFLPVMVTDGNYARVDFYQTNNGGTTWGLTSSSILDGNMDLSIRPPLTLFPGGGYVMVIPYSDRIVSFQPGRGQTTIYNRDYRSAGITEISMANDQVGWALNMAGDCNQEPGPDAASEDSPKSDIYCLLRKRLMRTSDGGATWEILRLPSGATAGQLDDSLLSLFAGNSLFRPSNSASASTSNLIGQGLDKCEMSTLSQMQQWWKDSPYAAVNLYIGGSARACANSLLSSSFLAQLFNQGWRFIPTWVGPQAPCTSFRSRFSYNLETAYNQGVSEANAALAAAANLGLTDPSQAGTLIYYDLEGYNTSSSACQNAVRQFMSGWTDRMTVTGNHPGVYGSVCASSLTDFATLDNPPETIWLAWWTYSAYSSQASLWGTACIPDSYWPNHQRIRQYNGTHTETWGGIAFSIDSNVIDSPLAIPYQADSGILAPSQPISPKPVSMSILSRTSDAWLYWTTNGTSCALHLWGGRTDLTRTGNCSSVYLGPMHGGAYSWQITATNAFGSTIGPVWTFDVQPYPPSGLVVTSTTATTVNLGWTGSLDEPADVDLYDIYINSQYVASLPAGASSATVTGLACNTNYSFFLRTKRQNVRSLNSNTVSATTGDCAEASWTATFTNTVPTGSPTQTYTPTRTPTSTPVGAFGKVSPGNGSAGIPASPTLSWVSSQGAISYNVCYDTSNNNACDTYWTNLFTTSLTVSGLDPRRTYYWQVVAVNPPGVMLADAGQWWSFIPNGAPQTASPSPSPTPTRSVSPSLSPTVSGATSTSTPPGTSTPTSTPTAGSPVFGKIGPSNGAVNQPVSVSLGWGDSAGASAYLYCVDVYNNNNCDSSWSVTNATRVSVSGLIPGMTYYWQVAAINTPASVFADNGAWWSFSIASAATTATPTPTVSATRLASATSTATFTPSRTPPASETLAPPSPTFTPSWTTVPPSATPSDTPTATSGPAAPFGKTYPSNAGTGLPVPINLNWNPSSSATSYIFCYDLIDNNACDTSWRSTVSLNALITGLVPGGIYYWQVIAVNPPAALPADDGLWWSFGVQP
jgi:photosystem II stability/assembly factor-like uncharacterized protein